MSEYPKVISDLENQFSKKNLVSGEDLIRLGIGGSSMTLSRWRRKKIGPPYIKIEGRYFYPSNLVLEWLRNGFVSTHLVNQHSQEESSI